MRPGVHEIGVKAYVYRPHIEKNVGVSDGSTVCALPASVFLHSSFAKWR